MRRIYDTEGTPGRPDPQPRAALGVAWLGVVAMLGLPMSGCVGPGDGGAAQASVDGKKSEGKKPEDDAIAVAVTPARRQPLSSVYSTSATLRANRRVTVTARTRGVVERLEAEEGDSVRSGVPLAVLENGEQTILFERARTTQEALERDYERIRRLHEQKLINDEVYERSRREAEDAKHAADLAKLQLDRTVVRAPFAGVILRRLVDVGTTVSDGTAVYELADLTPIYADINVPEQHAVGFGEGQMVRLYADAAERSVEASIQRIAPVVDPGTGTVKVTVAVSDSPGLRPGSFVRVAIVVDTHPEALVVPRSALVAEGRRWQLFRVGDAGDTVERLEVRLGHEEGDLVEILEVVGETGSLEAGMQVVTAGAPALSDGARIRVLASEPEGA